MANDLRLRPLHASDEQHAESWQSALRTDDFTFLLFHDPERPWAEYTQRLAEQRLGLSLGEGSVRAAFLVAEVNGEVVGRSSIRFELNDYLATVGGHIGYAVLPEFRRKGYASEILRQSLVIVRSEGVDRVLITCDEDNVGSARTIESCGGVFESVAADPQNGETKRRYWIN